MLSRPLAIAITILVSVVWATNVVVGMIYPDRHDATVNAVFAIIVGAVFGLTPKAGIVRRARTAIGRRIAGEADPEPPSDAEAVEPEPNRKKNTKPPPRGDDG